MSELHGTAYLRLERKGSSIRVSSVSTRRPTKPGVHVRIKLTVPVSAFDPYVAELVIPESTLDGVIVVEPVPIEQQDTE